MAEDDRDHFGVIEGLTNRCRQPVTALISTFDLMKQFSRFAIAGRRQQRLSFVSLDGDFFPVVLRKDVKMARKASLSFSLAITICIFVLTGCSARTARDDTAKGIVGAWFVKMPEAPFHYHMLIFHADGTVVQSNPDAGDAHTSDSSGMGAWSVDNGRVIGKFVEVTADRTTRQFVSRGEISFNIDVRGDTIDGDGSARFYDVNGALNGGPVSFTLFGTRVKAK
jgi:hypothetical protein